MLQKITAAGGLVLNENNELLMIFRRGKWDLPKGKLDEGETVEECAIREVEEETGIRNIALGNFVGLTYHEYLDKHINADVVKETHWFKMHVKDKPKPVPQTEEDIAEIIWADDNLIERCLQNTYQNILEIIKKLRKL